MHTLQRSVPYGRTSRPEPQPLPATSENRNKKPPRPSEVAGGILDPDFIEGYLRSLRDSLAIDAYVDSDNDSELMNRSR